MCVKSVLISLMLVIECAFRWPCHWAAIYDHLKIIDQLINVNCNTDAADKVSDAFLCKWKNKKTTIILLF